MSGQCCSAGGDGGLAMGSRPLTSHLLILLHTLQSFGTCHSKPSWIVLRDVTWDLQNAGSSHFVPQGKSETNSVGALAMSFTCAGKYNGAMFF